MDSMGVLLIFENKDVRPWAKILKSKLPQTTVEVYPQVKNAAAVDFVVCWKPKKNVLIQFPNIKLIQSVGASVDHIINTQIINEGTKVARIVDEKLSHDMLEFLLTVVLTRLKNTETYQRQKDEKIWQQHSYKSINETTVAILGLGKIGGYVAEKLAQLGFNVKGWSSSEKKISNVESFTGEHELDLCLQSADFLINLLPYTDKTKDILNKTTLQNLPPHAFLINVGRGEHLVDADLVDMLDSSSLSGALLDVFRTEPLPKDHPFWNHPKIQITPHVASLTNIKSAIGQIVENYYRFIHNKELLNIVSLNKAY
jgi:glyoxylate/hydroxypyruvate reductase A